MSEDSQQYHCSLTLRVSHIEQQYALLRHPPVEGEVAADQVQEKSKSAKPDKYQHSALGEERADRIIERLQELMNQKRLFENPGLSLGMLANELGVPRHYLSQSINTRLGETFFAYVNRLRVEASTDLLLTTNLPVTEISLQCGFNSRSSFYNAFKKRLGISPAQFRKKKN